MLADTEALFLFGVVVVSERNLFVQNKPQPQKYLFKSSSWLIPLGISEVHECFGSTAIKMATAISASDYRLIPYMERGCRAMLRVPDMSHREYISMVMGSLYTYRQEHNGEDPWRTTGERDIFIKMLYLDFDPVIPLLADLYSHTGHPAYPPTTVLRSWFLFVMTRGGRQVDGSEGIDKWIKNLRNNSFFYTLAGCRSKKECPSVGAHYEVLDKIWQGDRARYKRGALYDARKNSKKQMKIGSDDKIVDTEFKVGEMAARFLSGERLSGNSERLYQQMLALLGVIPSINNGVLPGSCITSFDSTAYHEHSSSFGKCSCGKERMNCKYRANCGTCAKFSAPDAYWGYLFY